MDLLVDDSKDVDLLDGVRTPWCSQTATRSSAAVRGFGSSGRASTG